MRRYCTESHKIKYRRRSERISSDDRAESDATVIVFAV